MPMQSNKLNFEGQNIFVGIDVHLKSWNVSVMVGGIKMKPFSQTPSASALKAHLAANYPGGSYHSAYESGFCGFSVHRQLMKVGINNIVFNAADVSDTQKERARKTDSADSAKIVRNLSNGELKAIHVPDERTEADRELLRTRSALVKTATQTKMRIKSMMFVHGIDLPEQFHSRGTHWSNKFLYWIEQKARTMPYNGGRSLIIQIDALRAQRKRILSVTQTLRKTLREDPEYKHKLELLIGIPGIGFLTAASFILEVGDITRFKNNDHLASFVGLVPDTRSSGDKNVVLGVTSRSNRRLRSMFIESSWIAIRHDPALILAYSKPTSKMEPNKAIIRIARKLVNRAAYVLRTGIAYEKGVM